MAQTLLKDLNIVILRTQDIEAARAFYGETLGMTLVSEGPGFFSVAPVDGQGANFGIGVGEVSAKSGAEVWWRVADVDALYEALKAKGVKILQEPIDRPFGRAMSFADPSGYTLSAFTEPAQ